MKRYLFLLILPLQLVNLRAQTVNYALPKVENGQWYITHGTKKIKLPNTYNYLNYLNSKIPYFEAKLILANLYYQLKN